ncbi:MAG: acyl-CoA dehydrogenase family protein [Thermoplasmatota archaeon]
MDRLPSEEDELIARTARSFAQALGLEAAALRDRNDTYPTEALAQAAQLGFAGMASAMPATALVTVLDEIAQVDANVATCLGAHNACVAVAAGHRAGAGMAAGEWASLLASEEAHGSDLGSIGTMARPAGSGWRITGQKVWAVNAVAARHLVVLAEVPGKGPALFDVASAAPGVSLGQGESLLGLRATGIRTCYLYDVEVGQEDVVGVVGEGRAAVEGALAWLQVAVAATLNGCVAGALRAASDFAQSRVQFQAPIGSYQAVSDGLATMDVQLAASRSLTLDAAARLGRPDGALWASRAKAFAGEMAIPMTRQAIRVQGGTGFMREGGTERFARDARALQTVAGGIHVPRDAIKRHLMPTIAFGPTP